MTDNNNMVGSDGSDSDSDTIRVAGRSARKPSSRLQVEPVGIRDHSDAKSTSWHECTPQVQIWGSEEGANYRLWRQLLDDMNTSTFKQGTRSNPGDVRPASFKDVLPIRKYHTYYSKCVRDLPLTGEAPKTFLYNEWLHRDKLATMLKDPAAKPAKLPVDLDSFDDTTRHTWSFILTDSVPRLPLLDAWPPKQRAAPTGRMMFRNDKMQLTHREAEMLRTELEEVCERSPRVVTSYDATEKALLLSAIAAETFTTPVVPLPRCSLAKKKGGARADVSISVTMFDRDNLKGGIFSPVETKLVLNPKEALEVPFPLSTIPAYQASDFTDKLWSPEDVGGLTHEQQRHVLTVGLWMAQQISRRVIDGASLKPYLAKLKELMKATTKSMKSGKQHSYPKS